MRTPTLQPHTTPREVASELFWFGVFSILGLTGALVVIAGFVVLADSAVQMVLGALLILAIGHAWTHHRIRHELLQDSRFRHARERRGF